MHSASIWPPLSERCRGLPRMPWPLWRLQQLQQLRVVLVSVLRLVGEQRGGQKQRRRGRQ
jgi:hypothetical protein